MRLLLTILLLGCIITPLTSLFGKTYPIADKDIGYYRTEFNRIIRGYGLTNTQVIVTPDPKPNAYAQNRFGLGNPSLIMITEGFIRLHSIDELRFILAHESSHILNNDMKMGYDKHQKIVSTPFSASGILYWAWGDKLVERRADLHGQQLYLKAGYDPALFENFPIRFPGCANLSPKDNHFCFKERAKELKEHNRIK